MERNNVWGCIELQRRLDSDSIYYQRHVQSTSIPYSHMPSMLRKSSIIAVIQGRSELNCSSIEKPTKEFREQHRRIITMSIYITKSVQFATKVEAFESRGLGGQSSSTAADGGVFPISSRSAQEQGRYARVAEELKSRLDGRHTLYVEPASFHNVLRSFTGLMFERPLLMVEMKSGGEVLNTLGMYEAQTGKMGLYAGKPDPEQISTMAGLGLDFYTTVPSGNTNLAGYIALIWAWRGLNAFFALGAGNMGGESYMYITESGAEKIAATEAKPAVEVRGKITEAEVPAKKAGGYVPMSTVRNVAGNVLIPAGIGRPVIVTPTDSKNLEGVVFPYFKEMLDADPNSSFRIFIEYFGRSLSDGAEGLDDLLVMLRRGFRNLASTHAGRIIQHLYFGMDLVIRGGGSMAVIKDGETYAGFVVAGQVKYLHKKIVKSSSSVQGVKSILLTLNTHEATLQSIYETVTKFGREDGSEEIITVEDLKENPRRLRELIQTRRANDMDQLREIIDGKLSDLKYSQEYWPITKDNIVKYLTKLTQRASMIDEPMYITWEVLANRSSLVLEYLSVFGGQAPSIYYGNTVKKISPVDKPDPNLEISGTRRSVPHVPYVKKGLVAAGNDWASVARQKAFKFAESRNRDGPMVGFSDSKKRDGIIDNPVFEPFYTLLRVFVYSDAVLTKGAHKRKNLAEAPEGGDDEEMTPPKKVKLSFV